MTAGNKHRNKAAKEERAGVGRREFLRRVGGASLVAANAGTLAGCGRADSESKSNDEKRKARYRVTEDVKNYYRVNRYPS